MDQQSPVTDLDTLIRQMEPTLNPGEYVFASVQYPAAIPAEHLLGTFREAEGTTVILPRPVAEQLGISLDYVAAWITLRVHSSLAAVGLTAAVATELSKHGISCNVIASYHHDHLFVDVGEGERAVKLLRDLAGPVAPATAPA